MTIIRNRAKKAETGEDLTPIDVEQMEQVLLFSIFGVLFAIIILFLESIAKELSIRFKNY